MLTIMLLSKVCRDQVSALGACRGHEGTAVQSIDEGRTQTHCIARFDDPAMFPMAYD